MPTALSLSLLLTSVASYFFFYSCNSQLLTFNFHHLKKKKINSFWAELYLFYFFLSTSKDRDSLRVPKNQKGWYPTVGHMMVIPIVGNEFIHFYGISLNFTYRSTSHSMFDQPSDIKIILLLY